MTDTTPRPRLLIVDDSRMVRAMIVKHIKGFYDYREEADGEAAWQTLLLDQSIKAVISDLTMPVLDGYGLLARIRNSKVSRIRELPVIMISGEEDEESRRHAREAGASDFITKGIGFTELMARLDSLVNKPAELREKLEASQATQVQVPATGLYSRKYVEEQLTQLLSHAQRHNTEVSVLVLGFDHFAKVRSEHGTKVADQLVIKFSKLLASKVRREDTLGDYDEAKFIVISPGTPYRQCMTFASRVREAIEVANIVFQGKPVRLTVSVGISNNMADAPHAGNAEALIAQAAARMAQSAGSGGNRVLGPDEQATASAEQQTSLERALALLSSGRKDLLAPRALHVAYRIIPLLKYLDEELLLDLPMDDVEARVREMIQAERKRG